MEHTFKTLVQNYKDDPKEETLKELFQHLDAMPLYQAFDDQKRIMLGKDDLGNLYLPLFSEREKVRSMNGNPSEEKAFSEMKHQVLLPESKIRGIIINPGEENVFLGKEDIFYMDQLLTGMTLERTKGVRDHPELRPAKKNPVLERELIKFAKENPVIQRINLYEGRRKKDEPYHLIIMVTFFGRDVDLFPALAERVRFFMKPGTAFELIPRNPKEKTKPELDDITVIYPQGK